MSWHSGIAAPRQTRPDRSPSVDRELAYVAAGKKQRLHDNESVSSQSFPPAHRAALRRQDSQAPDPKRRQKKMLHQFVAQLAAASVAHHMVG